VEAEVGSTFLRSALGRGQKRAIVILPSAHFQAAAPEPEPEPDLFGSTSGGGGGGGDGDGGGGGFDFLLPNVLSSAVFKA
jgi:hypothetical protein